MAELRDYLVKNAGAYDIEVMRWWTARPIVYSNATVMEGRGWIHTLFPSRHNRIKSSDGTIEAEIICLGDGSPELDDLERRSECLKKEIGNIVRKLRIRITQNGLGYDNKMLDKTPGTCLPGSDNSRFTTLKFRANVMGTKKGSRDRTDVDLMNISRSYFSSLTNDAKIETSASFLDNQVGLNLGFMKIINYQEHDDKVELARHGDLDAADTLFLYALDDAVVEFRMGQWVLPIGFNIADICQVTYFNAFNNSPSAVARMYSEQAEFSALHRPSWKSRLDDEFNETAAINEVLDHTVKWKHKKGFKKDVLVAYYPFASNFKEILLQDKQKTQMMELAQETKCPIESYMYNRILEGWSGEVIEDLRSFKAGNLPEAVLRGKYNNMTYGQLKQIVADNLKNRMKPAFANTKILNHYRTIYFLDNITDEEAIARGFVPFGRAHIMSIDRGRIIYNMNGEILSSGISIPSKKKRAEEPGRNSKSAFEIKVLRDFAEKYFESPKEAHDFAIESARELNNNQVELEDLLMRVRKKTEPKDMPMAQQKTRRGRLLKAFPETEIEESIIYMLISPDGVQESFMRYNPEDSFGAFISEPAIHLYQEKIFGKDSQMDRIVSALLSGEKRPLARGESLLDRLSA